MFTNLLFGTTTPTTIQASAAPIWQDLHLTQLFQRVCKDQGADETDLLPFCYQPLTTAAAVVFRQEIFHDLEQAKIYQTVMDFIGVMNILKRRRAHLTQLDPEPYQQEQLLRLLQAEQRALANFHQQLIALPLAASGLLTLRQELGDYLVAPATKVLQTRITQLDQALTKISYQAEFQGRHVWITTQTKTTPTFAKVFTDCFQGLFAEPTQISTPVAKLVRPGSDFDLDNLQTSVLLRLQHLEHEKFQELADFCQEYQTYQVPGLAELWQALQFYLVWTKIIQHLRHAGLSFCLPKVVETGTEQVHASFDLELALQLDHRGQLAQLVTNDYQLPAASSFLVISGPNQGGKTTYARMVGEDYYLMALGLPIPGTAAQLKLKPLILTHFERVERAEKISGLLATDVERMHQIVQQTTPTSFVIMNELFSSTTAADGLQLANKVLDLLQKRQASGIYITFLTELGQHAGVLSMMSQVAQGTTKRTYQVIPQTLDGQAYALTLLQSYHLRAQDLERRLE
ncbi:MutS-related protein [Lapidilactobacillus luobeiensis]|uniref:MutS-related protein n=1 Tax=Lapidilactobacillus luobeiensis TaxID=2950371 RepID=UPI0021C31A5F|nr:hypothetical protein [Lapidilactobacillus luobeiensis]